MTEWKRPASVPFPSIWRTFEGKKEINGSKRKYWVQDVSEEYVDAFIGYMTAGLLCDEALCKYSKIMEDSQSEQEVVEIWREIVKKKLALVCLTKDENGEVQIAGGNFTERTYRDSHFDPNRFKGKACRKLLSVVEHIYKVRDIYTELNIDSYLTAMGLYVLPDYRGEGIGLEILKARLISGMAPWKRPETVPYPSIWRTFQGKQEINGIKPKYWVQDLTAEYKEEILHIMKTGFLRDEALCKYSHVIDDEQAVKEFEELWIELLEEKLSIICLTKNSEDQIQLVGVNVMGITYKGQKSEISPWKSKLYNKIISLLEYVTHLKDDIVYTELGVNEYLTAMGLYILPEFRGQGIATEIVNARRKLCLAVGLKGSGTIF